MIVEDEKELVRIPLDLNENPSATVVLPSEVRQLFYPPEIRATCPIK